MVNTAAQFGGLDHEFYDSILGPAQLDAIAADLTGRLPAQPPGDVLEMACGTGIVTRRLRQRLEPGVKLVASDLSPAMIDFARNKLGGEKGIEWREADAANLPFADASFGAVVCSLGVMFVPDKRKAFAEARRVLREGGLFLFNVWDSLQDNPHGRIAAGVIEELFPGDPEMQFAKIPFGFHDQALIRSLLAEQRLRALRMEKTRTEIHCETAQRFATGMIRGTPRGLLIRQRGKSLDEVIGRLAAALARVGGEAPLRLPAQVLVVEAQAV
jgi:ubiquinone/menaquinone biosynthesis C-methylase UbiE